MKHSRPRPWCAVLALCLGLAAPAVQGQEPAADTAPVFRAEDELSVRIEAPFGHVLRSRGEDAEYFPARLVLTAAADGEQAFELEVRTRGNFRNRERVCRFPPLMLDFPRSALEGTVFEGENRLKLVTHCQPRARYRQYVLLEYLAYRALNLLTDTSLRVRLLALQYVDSDSGRIVAAEPGFLLESVESLARRRELGEVTIPRVGRGWYDPAQLTLVTLFHYFLGSVDWSAVVGADGEPCCHNIVPLQNADGDFIALAYDFDMSGLVDPSYAFVPRQLGIRRLTQRLWRGGCPADDALALALAGFQARREAIRALFETEEGLSEGTRRRSLAFIDEFYEVLDDSEKLHAEVLGNCP